MSLTVEDTARESPHPDDDGEKRPGDSPPSSVVTPNVEAEAELPPDDAEAADAPAPGPDTDQPMHDASVVPQIDAAPDPADIPVHPPHGTPPPPPGELLPDVLMAEADAEPEPEPHANGINGNGHRPDAEHNAHTPNLLPMSTPEASTSYLSPKHEDEDDDHPPPAKRPRVHSDADKASLANSATPPPFTAESPTAHFAAGPGSVSSTHHRFMATCIKSLKKQKDAAPFLRPVDPIALNIPHYPSIIPNPMDFGTIERKVASSNPARPDSNSSNPRYSDIQEFINDVHQVFQNCYKFNGAEHAISTMARRLEEVFDRQVKNMPTGAVEAKPVIAKKATPPPPPPPKKLPPVRRPSTSVPARREPEPVARPKREVHPPTPKDIPFVDPSKKRKSKRKDDGTAEQLKYCLRIIQDLFKKQHYDYANPFYEPVDWMAMNLPSYPKVVKKPMDLTTMRKKLEAGEYPNAQRFADDFKLMIRNCFTFNPPGTPVCQAGVEIQRIFDIKFRQLPEARSVDYSDDDDDDEASDDDHNRAIQELEAQMKQMAENLAALKAAKAAKEKKKKQQEKIAMAKAAPQPSTSKPPPKAPKQLPKKSAGGGGSSSSKPPKKAPVADDDSSLSFSQKKDLSEAIQQLDGVKLERVIKIIHEGFPEIRDSTEEIEIEIDRLPGPVLTKLYNFVIRPTRVAPPKRSRHGKGTGTGGLKRKSMDEDVEAEKIRQLEQRMLLFDSSAGGGAPPALPAAKAANSDSDSSSGSDSSGSDSD